MSDCLKDDDVHLPFANGGVLPVEEIFDTIKSTDFAGYLTLEIKPKSLSDIPTYINSYTYALKKLHYFKYLTTSLKVFFIRPFIKKILN